MCVCGSVSGGIRKRVIDDETKDFGMKEVSMSTIEITRGGIGEMKVQRRKSDQILVCDHK